MAIIKNGEKDVTLVVWLGILGLLFLAVAVYEGWIGAGGTIDPMSSDPIGDIGISGPSGLNGGTNLFGGPYVGFEQVDSISSFFNWLVSL